VCQTQGFRPTKIRHQRWITVSSHNAKGQKKSFKLFFQRNLQISEKKLFRELWSILPTFFLSAFDPILFCKKIQISNVSAKKLKVKILCEKAMGKMLVKLTPDILW
jgi:hypothetical protein